MAVAIKPCPFCGSEAVDCGPDDGTRGYTVSCLACEAVGPWVPITGVATPDDREHEAITRWNRRTP